MKKIFLLLSLIVVSFQLSLAQIVAKETALTVAKNMYYERSNISGQMSYDDISFSQDFVISHDQQPVYYVFNVSGNRGFVVVAAEERAVPVLHYSFEGSYDPNNLADGFVFRMNNYEQQIVAAREYNVAKEKKISDMWSYYTAPSVPLTKAALAVAPLLGSLAWDQGCYYNAQCPAMSGGDCNKCPTGCVATAMAQIMKYHAYPAHGYSSHSYAHTTANGFANNFGTLTANFGATTYNWGSMPNNVGSSNSSVATLMYHCGVSVEMNYDVNGSGAFLSDAANALNLYFTYSCSYSVKSMYTDAVWKSMLKNSIDSLRPVLYGGQDATFGGHAFVCDGYQGSSNDYFHFNFGWSGSSNGYEYVDAITPSGTPDNFSTNQEAIFNIHPEPATIPVSIFTANKTSVAPAELVVLTNTSTNTPLNYAWTVTPNSGLTFVGGTSFTSKNLMLRFANTGYYTISLTATNSAGSDTETKTDYIHVWIDESGIQQTETLKNISIFPNPSDGVVTISTGQALSDAVSVKVYNIIGSEVANSLYTTSVKDNNIVLDLSACRKGLYFIKVTTAKGTVTRKIELTK